MRHTDATKTLLSDMRRGERNPFFGRTHSPETRQRMSESATNRNLSRTYEPAPQRISLPDMPTLAYVAGLVDADGSIRFITDNSTTRKVRRPFIAVYNTNVQLIAWLSTTFGHGSVSKGNSGRQQVLAWRLTGARDVYALCNAIRPWLIVKAADADTAIAHLRGRYSWD